VRSWKHSGAGKPWRPARGVQRAAQRDQCIIAHRGEFEGLRDIGDVRTGGHGALSKVIKHDVSGGGYIVVFRRLVVITLREI
jgi:hypothetical protein